MVCPGSRRIKPFLSQKTVHITLPADGCAYNFVCDGEFTRRHSIDRYFDSGSQW
jgi:hypothetical protein